MDPGTRRLVFIACGLGGALIAVIGGWTMVGRHAGTVPVIQADSRPVRVKPENPGGMQVAGANEDILSGGTESKDGKLAPPPETPAPQSLRNPPPQPAPPAATPPVVAPSAPVAMQAAPPTPAKPVTASKPNVVAEKRAVPVPEHPAQAGAKGVLVQLAAVRSEEAAKTEWQRLSKRMPELFGERHPAFTKTEHAGQALWRVRTGGFNDVSQATQFCERVRAKGAGCSVADF